MRATLRSNHLREEHGVACAPSTITSELRTNPDLDRQNEVNLLSHALLRQLL